MELQKQLSQQRVKHIVSSYQLRGEAVGQRAQAFEAGMAALLHRYPAPLIELALVETLMELWRAVPLVRGLAFLEQVQAKLVYWEGHPIVSTVTPQQFRQVTGLDPSPIFGSSSELPPQESTVPPF